jgi:hypothetical protein
VLPREEGGDDRPPLTVERFTPDRTGEWDEFVDRSRNGTLFHQRRFLAYHAEGRFLDDSLMLYREGRLVAVYPAAIEAHEAECWSVSHPGSSYGGPVLARDASLADVTAVVRAIVEHALEMGTHGLRMRLSEQAFRVLPTDEVEFVLWTLGFQLVAKELSTTIALAEGADAARARYRSDTARSVRSAARNGVIVDWSDDFPAFWAILEQNLRRHGAQPTHSLAEMDRLRALCGDDRIRLMAGRVGGEMAAGVVVFVANPAVFHSFYIAQNYAHQQTRALSAVIDGLIAWGTTAGYRWFNLGISTEARGQVVNWGLFRFKEGFGGSGFNRTTHALRLAAAEQAA